MQPNGLLNQTGELDIDEGQVNATGTAAELLGLAETAKPQSLCLRLLCTLNSRSKSCEPYTSIEIDPIPCACI